MPRVKKNKNRGCPGAISRNTFKSNIIANERYNLSLPLTAGWDSRVLMSATKQIFSDIEFYTLKYRSQTESSQDIRIPARL